jgi:hypothetical protein
MALVRAFGKNSPKTTGGFQSNLTPRTYDIADEIARFITSNKPPSPEK